LPDADDEPILQLAFEAQVPYIVTRNARDFAGAERFGIQVMSPSEFLKLIRSQP
jgi:predicted nucleic acid-binding protein